MRVRPGLMVFVFTGIVAIVGLACGQSTTPTPVPSQPAAPAAAPTAVATQPPLAAANPTAMPTAVTASAPTPARSPPAQPAPSSANEVRSDIKDFVLEDLTVPVGTTVIWENRDGTPHTTTSGNSPSPSGVWDSPLLRQGGAFQFTFDQPGSFPYFCTVHPDMVATVTVTDSASPALAAASPTAISVPVPAATQPPATQTPAALPSTTATPAPTVTPTPQPVANSPTVIPAATPAPAAPTATPVPATATPTTVPTSTPEPMGQTVDSDVVNFTLEDLNIPRGTTVTWHNLDAAPHTSTSGVSPTPSGVWDSGIFNQGGSFSFTFEETGSFPYFCTVHPFMVGTITVTEAEQATATPAPPVATPVPPTPAPSATPAPAAQTVESSIINFTLENLNVSVGTMVTWENFDGAPHTSTAGVSPNASGEWDSGILNMNQDFQFTFDEPGQFPYFCTVHPFMTATVTVQN